MTLRVYTHYRQKQREQETTTKVLSAVSYLSGPEDRPGKVVALRA
jgi:hypothetical protein